MVKINFDRAGVVAQTSLSYAESSDLSIDPFWLSPLSDRDPYSRPVSNLAEVSLGWLIR
jgi:hypothetical protein